MDRFSLLTIEDETITRRTVRMFFEDHGFEVFDAEDGLSGLAIFREKKPDVVLVDLRMPGISGLEVIETLAREAPGTPLVVFSGIGVIEDAIEAIRLGAWDYVSKPIADMRQLLHRVQSVLERALLREESRLHQIYLEAEVKRRTREFAELNERLKGVVHSCRAITAAAGLPQLTRQLLEGFAANIGVRGGSLYLIEGSGLILKHTLDPGHATSRHNLPLPADSVLGKVLNSRMPLLIEDIGKDENIRTSGWSGYHDGSLLAFPLFDSAGDPRGVVALHNKLEPPFTEHDREIGTVLASCGSEALRATLSSVSLRTSEATLRTFVNAIPEPALLLDRNGDLLLCNEALAVRFGRGVEELEGGNAFELLPPEVARIRRRCAEEVFRTGNPVQFEDSREGRYYLNSFCPVKDASGETLRVAVLALDITDRILAERALKENEEKYRDLVENINDVVFSVDTEGRVTYVSPVVETVTGYRPEEVIGRHYREFFLREDRPGLDERLKSVLEGNTESREYETRGKSGELLWVRSSGRPIQKEGKIVGLQGSLSDITAKKLAERELAKRAEELSIRNSLVTAMAASLSVEAAVAAALDHFIRAVIPDLAMLFLLDGKRLIPRKIVSPGALSVAVESSPHRVGECLCGLAVETGGAVYSRDIHADPRCTLEECRLAGIRSFAALPLNSGGETIGILGVASAASRDFAREGSFLEALAKEIAVGLKNALLYEQARADALELLARLTRIQQAEEDKARLMAQLQQSQKMEAVGTLAGGIAHDFNNILTPIIMGAQMVLGTLPDPHPGRALTQKIVMAGERARDLVGQILTFSRQSDMERRPLSLVPVAKEAIKLARSSLPSTIEIRQHLKCEHDSILANPTQILQVLMNLITNAAHAMRGAGGVLEIDLKGVDLDETAVADMPDLQPGRFARLSIRDTGHGMEPQTLQQIFNPFFTTKERGEGTGLGLSIVHGIVRSCDGGIAAESKVGEGTTFTIHLPILLGAKTSQIEETAPLPRGTESVLLVDDEAEIVDIVAQMLRHLGYRVDARTDALEALEVFGKVPGGYDLVITDLTMPNLTGDKLAAELKRIRPDVPIILCSGYSDQADAEKVKDGRVSAFITKPLGPNLPILIREVLSALPTGR